MSSLLYGRPEQAVAGNLTPRGFQQITTALSASTALTVPAGARLALIHADGVPVRWRDDGTAPTASVGMVIAAGETLPYNADLDAIRLIQAASGAVVNVSYYG